MSRTMNSLYFIIQVLSLDPEGDWIPRPHTQQRSIETARKSVKIQRLHLGTESGK